MKMFAGPMRRITDGAEGVAYLAAMVAVLSACGWLVAGIEGAVITSLTPLVIARLAPRLSARALMGLQRAVPIGRWELQELQDLLARLARRAGLSRVPALYWHGNPAIMAFTAGQDGDAAVAVTAGALRHLSRREIEGVLAHEIAHIATGDVRLTVWSGAVHWVTSVTGMLGLLFWVLIFAKGGGEAVPIWMPWSFALAPSVISLLQLALSRSRELAADAGAVRLTGDGLALASALAKIKAQELGLWKRFLGRALPDPTPGLLRTHPPTEERIAKLLSGKSGASRSEAVWPTIGRRTRRPRPATVFRVAPVIAWPRPETAAQFKRASRRFAPWP